MDVNSDEWRSKLNYVRRKWHVKEDVVISGMSGRFPKSENIQEFTENLFNGVDMVTSGNDRFPSGVHGFPTHSGKVENLNKFDAELFGIPDHHANFMDPQLRKLLEVSFEAIVDAGISVKDLNGSNTGVFFGSSFQETEMALGEDPQALPNYLQNYNTLVSQAFGLKGPIGQFDTACGSSTAALNEAFIALKSGVCDRALVAGFNICLLPAITQQFCDLQMVSPSGRSKALDESADGYGRSEAVCCIMLQLKPEAKRIYSTIVNCRSNADGYKDEGITFPSVFLQRQLMAETYDEVGIDPTEIEYVESHTTGTQVGDPVELKAIYDVFCYQRSADNPLKIGCLKSNMGHSEAASGLCALIKANIVFQSGYIPGNLHYNKPNPRIEGLADGKMVPILEKIPFTGDYISLNCFGFGGANVHMILKGYKVTSQPECYNIVTQIPRLIPICSRTWEGVKRIQMFLEDNQSSLTNGFLALLNQFSRTSSMPYKGYTLISKENESLSFNNHTENRKSDQNMKIVLILPADQVKFDLLFMQLSIFSNTLDRLAQYVKPLGIDLAGMISGELFSTTMREKIVATVATQLILYNLLKALNVPIGDFVCNWLGHFTHAFAKNLITEERAMTAAYWLGHSIDHEGISSTLFELADNFADQEKSYENDSNSSDIDSGTESLPCIDNVTRKSRRDRSNDIETNFISELSFINTLLSFIDNYCRNIENVEKPHNNKSDLFFKNYQVLQQINTKPFKSDIGDLNSDAILIDCNSSVHSVKHPNGVKLRDSDTFRYESFLKSIGQLYTLNIPIDMNCLSPQTNYPVPIDTLSLHSLIDFDHHKSYKVFKYPEHLNPFAPKSSFSFKLSLGNPEDRFYSDHKIDGRILFPATGMLMYAWKVAAVVNGLNIRRSKFLFRDVSFVRATTLTAEETCLKVSYMPHNGSFIITESDSPIAVGKIFIVENIDEAKSNFIPTGGETDGVKLTSNEEASLDLCSEDIYKELRNRGYDYGSSFRCLTKADQYGRRGVVEWKEVSSLGLKSGSLLERTQESDSIFLKTWVTFADSVMQLALLSNRMDRSLFVPTGIESLLVDADKLVREVNLHYERNYRHKSGAKSGDIQESMTQNESQTENQSNFEDDRTQFPVAFDHITRTVASESLWIRGLKTSLISRRPQKVIIETREFIPLNEEDIMDSKLRNQLTTYHRLCDKYTALIKNDTNIHPSINLNDMAEVIKRDFPYEKDASFSLLEFLIDSLEKNGKELEIERIEQDLLIGKELHYSFSERFLRPFIGTVVNTYSYSGQINPTINIIEYNQGRNYYFETIKATIDALSIGTAELNYKVAFSQQSSEAKESLQGVVPSINWDAESPLSKDFARASLIIYKNYSGDLRSFETKVQHLTQAIIQGGFLLVIFREHVDASLEKLHSIPQLDEIISDLKACCMRDTDIIGLMENLNWICVSNRLLETKLMPIRGLLFRKRPKSVENHRIIRVSPINFEWIEKMQSLLKAEDKTSPIWLIGDGSCDQGVDGFMRSLGMEIQGDRIFCIANRFVDNGLNIKNVNLEDSDFKQIVEKRLKLNVYDPDLGWGEFNFFETEREQVKDPLLLTKSLDDVELKILQPGDLSSLRWCESSNINPTVSQVRSTVRVCYAPLNFKDVLLSTARLPRIFEPSADSIGSDLATLKIGLEFAGYDINNQRVMGAKGSGAMATQISIGPTDLIWPVPDHWTLEDAATVPVVYATTIYGLIMRGNLKRGESVLIHAGSGGVGIAAIHLCLSYNCTIYTTVGTPEKRKFILDRFPQLAEANIGNSRDTSFEEMILRETGGRGVDIVLNSLADDKLQASLRCLAPGGRFIEIGKYDGFKNSPIELGLLDEGRSFHGVMLDSLFNVNEHQISWVNRVESQLNELFEGFLKNGAIQPLPRTVFEMDRAEEAFRYMAAGKHIGKVILRINDSSNIVYNSIPVMRTIKFCQEKVYVIVGGFGGLGLEITLWMVLNGARKIVINSRSGPKTPYHQYCLDRIVGSNSNVTVSKHDLTTEAGTRELFSFLSSPVGGIFNSALVLNDGLFVDQTPETFVKVCASKVNITHNLDRISREMCPTLDYFVVFSSIVSGRGNVGQTNYGLANSFMESVCERRRRDGLHGLAIQWGLIGDVGFVVEKMGADIESIRGTAAQRLHSCFSVLERVLNHPSSSITSMVRSEDKKLMSDSSGDIIKSICHILGIKDIYALDPKITLGELGMDSLMAIEVQQALERNFNVSITSKEIRQLKVCDLIELSKKCSSGDMSRIEAEKDLRKLNIEPAIDVSSLLNEPIKILNDKIGVPMFAFPPVEGQYDSFGALFEQLKQPVVGINWTYDLANITSVEEAATLFANRVSNLTSNQEINMIGYSFGGVLALNIAKVLEKRESGPKVSKIVLFDADLEYIKKAIFKLAISQTSSDSESVIEEQFIRGCLKRHMKDTSSFDEDFKKAITRSERFGAAKKFMISQGIEPAYADTMMKMNELTLHKSLLISKHNLQRPSNCKIIHLRAEEDLPSLQDIDKDSSIGEQYYFSGNHNNFIVKNLEEILSKMNEFLTS